MAESFEEIALHPNIIRKQWLPLDTAVREIIAFEKVFGMGHFLLACHAALPSLLTPELLHFIRINFLDQQRPRPPWIAEMDFLLSPLCRPIEKDLFEVEPMVREALLFKLEERYGWQHLQNMADFLLQYVHKNHENKQNAGVTQVHDWIAQSYLQPDKIVQELAQLLNESIDAQSSDYQTLPKKLRIVRSMELLADPLRHTTLQDEYASLVHSTRVLAYTLYGRQETFPTAIRTTRSTSANEQSNALFPPAVQQWLNTIIMSQTADGTTADITEKDNKSEEGVIFSNNFVASDNLAVSDSLIVSNEITMIEEKRIDNMLRQAGWIVQHNGTMNASTIQGTAIRSFPVGKSLFPSEDLFPVPDLFTETYLRIIMLIDKRVTPYLGKATTRVLMQGAANRIKNTYPFLALLDHYPDIVPAISREYLSGVTPMELTNGLKALVAEYFAALQELTGDLIAPSLHKDVIHELQAIDDDLTGNRIAPPPHEDLPDLLDYLLIIDGEAVGTIEVTKESMRPSDRKIQTVDFQNARSTLKFRRSVLPFIYEVTGSEIQFTNTLEPEARSRRVSYFHQPGTLAEWLGLAPVGTPNESNNLLRSQLRRMPQTFPYRLASEALLIAITKVQKSLATNHSHVLVQIPNDRGNTTMLVNMAYRLLILANVRRILYLVDNNRDMSEVSNIFEKIGDLYEKDRLTKQITSARHFNTQLLQNDTAGDPTTRIYISTAEQFYSIFSGRLLVGKAHRSEPGFLPEEKRTSMSEVHEIRYNPSIPIEFFNVILIDDYIPDTYRQWYPLLEYFDSFIIGTASNVDEQTLSFFKNNLVYSYEEQDTTDLPIIDNAPIGNERDAAHRYFSLWLEVQQRSRPTPFTEEQILWLERIRNRIASDGKFEEQDFNRSPFEFEGGLVAARFLLGKELPTILQELNTILKDHR